MMLSRLRQTLVVIVAVVVLGMLWFVGNDIHDAAYVDAGAVPGAGEQLASVPRGIPRNGTLEPISIDASRPANPLPQYQAESLVDDYRDNAGVADDRYLGKYFIVEGVASGIRRDNASVFLEIRTNRPGEAVRANLLQQQICGPAGRTCEVEARATMVRRGQKVAVECTGAGQGDGGTPLLTDCLIRGGAN